MARSIEYQPNNGSWSTKLFPQTTRETAEANRGGANNIATTSLWRLRGLFPRRNNRGSSRPKLHYAKFVPATSFDEQRGKNKFPFSLIRFFGFSPFFLFFFSSPLPCSRVIEEIISHELTSESEEVDSFKRIFREGESVQFPKEISFD